MITIRLVLVLILFLLLFTRQKTSRPLYNDKSLPSNVTVSSELATIPDRICSLWCFTRDSKLRNISCPPNHRYAYGLTFQVNRRTSHALICILLSGDISLNPGPNSQHQQPQTQSLKGYPATCLVINARSLKSLHLVSKSLFIPSQPIWCGSHKHGLLKTFITLKFCQLVIQYIGKTVKRATVAVFY